MSRKKRKRGRGRVLILVVLLALIVFGVFARGIFTSGKTTTEHAQRELHTYAEQHETSLADYPDALVQLYARNPDARDFVRDYPKKKDLTPTIDLSNLSGSKTVPLLLQWDERWGYREYNESIIGLAGCGPTCLSMATIYLTGDTTKDPLWMCRFAEQNQFNVPGSGSKWALISEVMRELDALRKMEKTDTDHHRANDARAALRRKLNAAEDAAAAAAHPQIQEKKVSARPVRVGDTVQLRKMGDIKATVTAVSADRTLSLRAGIMNVTAKEQDVYLLENEKPEAEKFAAAHAASLRSVAAESEIDLRGMDSMEAVAATERFLDNAVMAKLEKVTIIHGKGTGALRAAVQQSLRRNKAVKSFRLGRYGEGESGVTVVELK